MPPERSRIDQGFDIVMALLLCAAILALVICSAARTKGLSPVVIRTDALVAQGVLTKETALNVLADAQKRVSGRTNPNAKQAAMIVGALHQRLMKT